jgi:hypothetical protein
LNGSWPSPATTSLKEGVALPPPFPWLSVIIEKKKPILSIHLFNHYLFNLKHNIYLQSFNNQALLPQCFIELLYHINDILAIYVFSMCKSFISKVDIEWIIVMIVVMIVIISIINEIR